MARYCIWNKMGGFYNANEWGRGDVAGMKAPECFTAVTTESKIAKKA